MKQKRPANETNEERFKRVAEPRTKAVLYKLELLGNCSNKRLYSYSQKDTDKIFSTINKRIRKIKSKFETHRQDDFKL